MAGFLIYFITAVCLIIAIFGLGFYLIRKNLKSASNILVSEVDIQRENAVLNERNNSLNKLIADKDIELKKIQEINGELQKKIIVAENNLTQSAEKINSFEAKINEIKDLYDYQQRQNIELNNKIQKLQKDNGELASTNNILQEFKDNFPKYSLEQFQNLANKIFEEKSTKFCEINSKNIDSILQPLGKNIEEFKKQVFEVYDKESKERFSLEKMVKSLQENTNKISEQANNLANALQGSSKKQGNWGEMILERILQNSGLTRDVNYFREKSFVNEEGKNLRPDFQILLPDDRLVVTDSKVSLNAYEKFCSTDNKEQQRIFINDHLNSIYSHIDNLYQKKYEELKKSLDFTIMFIPIEPAYLLAIQQDPQLWAYAYQKKILIVSSTNLIVCLKLINDLWQRENQSRNANKIVKSAERLLDKLLIFCESFVKIGKQIDGLNISYNTAFNQISQGKGNVISQVKNLSSNFGLNNSKQIPEILLNNLDDEELTQELIVEEEITKQN